MARVSHPPFVMLVNVFAHAQLGDGAVQRATVYANMWQCGE